MQQSDSINEIALALAKAQSEMGLAEKSSTNPFYKSSYANLASVIEAIKVPLSKNGIAFTQFTQLDHDLGPMIVTQLSHSSGQWMRGFYPIKCKDISDPQKLGSAQTYARRYALRAAVGLAEEDDDGNSASQSNNKERQSANEKTKPAKTTAPKQELKHQTNSSQDFIWPWGNTKGKPLAKFSTGELVAAQKWLLSWTQPTKERDIALNHIENILGA